MPGQVTEGERDTRFEPVLNRYRRAPGDLNDKKLSCTLKMRVSCLLILFCIIRVVSSTWDSVLPSFIFPTLFVQKCGETSLVTCV